MLQNESRGARDCVKICQRRTQVIADSRFWSQAITRCITFTSAASRRILGRRKRATLRLSSREGTRCVCAVSITRTSNSARETWLWVNALSMSNCLSRSRARSYSCGIPSLDPSTFRTALSSLARKSSCLPRSYWDELKLTDIHRGFSGSVLAKENDGLIGSIRHPKFEEYIRIVPCDVGNQKRGRGNLVGNLLHQLLCEHIAIPPLDPDLVPLFEVSLHIEIEEIQLRPKRHHHEAEGFTQAVKRSVAREMLLYQP